MAFPGRSGGLWEPHRDIVGPWGQRINSEEFGAGIRSPKTVYQQQSSYYNQQTSSSRGSGGVGGVADALGTAANKFRICVDVRQFAEHELEVKTTEKFVVVHGKHEEREDEHGLVAREFTRRYPLPKEVDPESVTSSLTTDGVLVIEAPMKAS